MSDVKVNIILPNLELLCCSVCKGYLSCAPVRVLPDGSNICGKCAPLDNEVAFRVPAIEAILSKAKFPCKFKQHGCTAHLLFGKACDHENKCIYLPLLCALSSSTMCTWEGPLLQFHEHFVQQHAELISKDAEFNVDIHRDKQGIVVAEGPDRFIVKYAYDSATSVLRYSVRMFEEKSDDRQCQIQLTNSLDLDYKVQLKGDNCGLYTADFYVMEEDVVVDVKRLLGVLNNPETITCIVHLPNPNKLVVNYDVLNSYKCSKCGCYLHLPIYEYKNCLVCLDCANSPGYYCQPSTDKKLPFILGNQNYPCRWNGCDFIAKGDDISAHEKSCNLRQFDCLFPYCSFNMTVAINHFESHNCEYFNREFTYNLSFSKCFQTKYAFTVCTSSYDRISYVVLIKFDVTKYDSVNTAHSLELVVTAPEQYSRGVVRFKHTRCKCESKRFFIYNGQETKVLHSELPHCFGESDDITGTIEMD